MKNNDAINMVDILGNYGKYVCNVGRIMDKYNITISKMRKLTGLNHEIVKKYYEDTIVRIDKDVFAKITYVISLYGGTPNELLEYIPPNQKID